MPCKAVCSAISSRMRRNFSEKFASQNREENIQHVLYFLPREANSSAFAATVRIWLSPINRSSNKIAWLTHVISELGSKWRRRWNWWLFLLLFYFDRSVVEGKLVTQRHVFLQHYFIENTTGRHVVSSSEVTSVFSLRKKKQFR